MPQINNSIKFILLNINILFALFGLALFGGALYLWCADWGKLESGFFVGNGAIIFLFGIIVILMSCIGCQGIDNQTMKFGFWTGRKMLFIYQMLLVGALIGESIILFNALHYVHQFETTVAKLGQEISVPMADIEASFGTIFDPFFFGASSSCKASLYAWFWSWINDYCPSQMSQQMCQGCYDYSVTLCPASQEACSSGIEDACPYKICRRGFLSYIVTHAKPFTYGMLALACLQLIMVCLNTMLICHHPRDDMQQILLKSGVISPLMAQQQQQDGHHAYPRQPNPNYPPRRRDEYIQMRELAPHDMEP